MSTRILLAGILAGIVMFIWNFIAHDLLPLGEMGIREFPEEAPLLDAMKTNLGDAGGLYLFPAHRAGPNATRQEIEKALTGIMCRCCAHSRMIDAIQTYAKESVR